MSISPTPGTATAPASAPAPAVAAHAGALSRRALLGGASLALAGTAARASARASAPLVVWFTVRGAQPMRQIAERFTAETGVPVVVETPDEGPAKFQQAASAGKGPDIYIYAHDRIGEWVSAGLLHEVHPPRALRDDIEPQAWRGFSLRGRTWGYPYAVEAVTLVVNRALVDTPPEDWDAMRRLDDRLAAQGRRAILWDYTNPYFTWPLLAAQGGYAFRPRADGSWDARDHGLRHPGTLAGVQLLERWLQEGRMPRGSGYPEMERAMAEGRVAMMINGPWSWANLQRVGIDFGTARLPALGGAPARPFVGIKGAVINRACRQPELAVEFIEHHLLRPHGLRAIDRAEPIGAPAGRQLLDAWQRDARVAGIVASARDGVPTPSVPEMGRFWSALKTALGNVADGRQGAAQALDAAARRVEGSGGAGA
jgi:maltose/maltodextrin transport system substrate-binding protein